MRRSVTFTVDSPEWRANPSRASTGYSDFGHVYTDSFCGVARGKPAATKSGGARTRRNAAAPEGSRYKAVRREAIGERSVSNQERSRKKDGKGRDENFDFRGGNCGADDRGSSATAAHGRLHYRFFRRGL